MLIKFCGLTRREDVRAAAALGVNYIGLNFYSPSPRSVSYEQAADLSKDIPKAVQCVGLVVNPSDVALDTLLSRVPLDMIQLHGDEPPERVADVKARYGKPVIKALGVKNADDVVRIDAYETVAALLIIDAKPTDPKDLPGGNGVPFDWGLIADRTWKTQWLLAGGLNERTVARGIQKTKAKQVDVASGIERAAGEKSTERMRDFVEAARSAL